MPTISIPRDMAADMETALRYAADTPAGTAFRELVVGGLAWQPARVRRLLAWAEPRHVCVSCDSERYLTVVLAGFVGSGWRQRMREAETALRQAARDVAAGLEPSLYNGNVWSMGEPDDARAYPNRPWSYGYEAPPLVPTVHYASPMDGFFPPPPPPSGPPPASPTSP
jgi:hypothetical protein